MEVSFTSDHVTHAIIGGGETINFGISNSAEFFNILSSTLYKDQNLAVVREVLCNAWDAHIEAGCTDKPIIVELADNKLIVRDSGNGIHHDDIGLIYGTYGNSTKKNDGKQTGGFGLGCKAPFAYTDHFEVISSNDGVRTIYAMAKSSAQVGGKPGITTIAQFPTTDRGLSVSINIKPSDMCIFNDLIKRIAYNGDMNIMLNGKQLDTIEFDTQNGNWMITGGAENPYTNSTDTFLVRYGNVIYPIDPTHSALADKANRITTILLQMKSEQNGYYWNSNILFQAPSHSIAVTPSRESLSMQDHTIKTIDILFSDFLLQIEATYEADKQKNVAKCVATAVADKNVDALLYVEPFLPGAFKEQQVVKFKATTIDALAKRSIGVRYPKDEAFRKTDVSLRVSELSKAGLILRGLATTYLRAVKDRPENMGYSVRSIDHTTWLKKKVVGKLATKLMAAGLDTSNLRVWDSNMETVRSDGMATMYRAKPRNIFNCLTYLRNIIVLTGSTADIGTRVKTLSNSPVKVGHISGFLFYVLGRKKGEKEAVQEFFAKSGMTVIDLTILEAKTEARTSTVVKPRPKGLPLLSEAKKATHSSFSMDMLQFETTKRIEDPKFVIYHPKNSSSHRIEGFNIDSSVALAALFGDECGICFTSVQYANWSKKTPKGMEYVETKVLDFVKGNQAIQEKMSTSGTAIREYIDTFVNPYSLQTMARYGLFSNVLGKKVILTEEETQYMVLFKHFLDNTEFATTAGPLADIALHKDCKTLVDKASKSTLLGLLDFSHLTDMLDKPAKRQKALNLFNHALNN